MDHSPPPLPPILPSPIQQPAPSPPPIQLAKLKLLDDYDANSNKASTSPMMLPTPVSPVPPPHSTPNFGSFISQFSIKPITSDSPPSPSNSLKQYACTECHQVFYRAHNLKSHKATHSSSSSSASSEKPYQCPSCEKQFLRLHDLKRHQKLHTGERPYICPVCKRSFSRLDALNRHRRTEGGSACFKKFLVSSPGTVFVPASIEQWQPGGSSSKTKPSKTASSTKLPPLILPLVGPITKGGGDELVETLRQRIHDLEIENRVLRSLLTNNNESTSPKKKYIMMDDEEEQEEDETIKKFKRLP